MAEKPKERALVLRADFADVYVSTYNNELMKPVRAQFKLSEAKGHFYKIQKKHVISSTGYIQLNKAASVTIVTPKSVIVDGKEEMNPYVERQPQTRAIDSVAVRKIGIGFSPIGNITVIDKTLFYNVYTYLIQGIQAKMKAKIYDKKTQRLTDKPKFPNCAIVGTRDDKPTKGKWTFFLTADPLGIWVNYEHEAILDCLEDHTQRQRFGDRIAQKICERNILRDHPAIGTDTVMPTGPPGQGMATVNIYSWRHDLTPHNLDDILRQAEQGSKEYDIKAEVVEPTAEEEKKEMVEETKTEEEITPKPGETEPPENWKSQAEKANAERAEADKAKAGKQAAEGGIYKGEGQEDQEEESGTKTKTTKSRK